jgi:Mn2+/Fe2+ NRAMP family transporter
VTRSVAVLPSLLVALIAGPEGSDELIVLSQVVLSLQLPFALIPLVKLTSSNLMGPWKNSVPVAALAWSLATGLVLVSCTFALLAYLFGL